MNLTLLLFFSGGCSGGGRGRIAAEPQLGLRRPVPRLNFATVAVFYLFLGAPFIALVQVTVYAGAIMVLFLFVIMLLGAEKLPRGKVLPWQRPLAIGLAALLLVEAGYLLFQRLHTTAILAAPAAELNTTATLQTLGMALFNQYLLPFEVTSLLLLVAMVGAIVLTKQVKGEQA